MTRLKHNGSPGGTIRTSGGRRYAFCIRCEREIVLVRPEFGQASYWRHAKRMVAA